MPCALFPQPPLSSRADCRRGFAMIVVLWSIGIMSLATMGFFLFATQVIDENTLAARRFEARLVAESGLAVALHPKVRFDDPVLQRTLDPLRRYEVRMRSEGSRINLAAEVTPKPSPLGDGTTPASASEEEVRSAVLVRLFGLWGLELDHAQSVVDCLMDWVDADNLKRLLGAERELYLDRGKTVVPSNRSFRSLREATQVLGFEEIIEKRPDWQEFFTLWGDGKIDLNDASAEVITAVTGLPLTQTERFVNQRQRVGEVGDLKPIRYLTLDAAMNSLGLYGEKREQLADLLVVNSPIVRIEVTGYAGTTACRLRVIARKQGDDSEKSAQAVFGDGDQVRYLFWEEF